MICVYNIDILIHVETLEQLKEIIENTKKYIMLETCIGMNSECGPLMAATEFITGDSMAAVGISSCLINSCFAAAISGGIIYAIHNH